MTKSNQNSKLVSNAKYIITAGFCVLPFLVSVVSSAETKTVESTTNEGVTRSEVQLQIPDVTVVRQDGKKLSILKELEDSRPVILDFIFTSCSGTCPLLSQTFSKLQTQLEKEHQRFHLVSISIDPENDTPAAFIEYAKKYKAGPNWDFYTGTQEASLAIQKAFNAYRGDKMNHGPFIFMRSAPGQPWVFLDGFSSQETLMSHYYKMPGLNKK